MSDPCNMAIIMRCEVTTKLGFTLSLTALLDTITTPQLAQWLPLSLP